MGPKAVPVVSTVITVLANAIPQKCQNKKGKGSYGNNKNLETFNPVSSILQL